MSNLRDIIQSDRDAIAFDQTEFGTMIDIDGVLVPGVLLSEQTQGPDMTTDWAGEDDGGYHGVAGRTIEIMIPAGAINIRAEQRRRINGLDYWISAVKRNRYTGTLRVKGFWGEG